MTSPMEAEIERAIHGCLEKTGHLPAVLRLNGEDWQGRLIYAVLQQAIAPLVGTGRHAPVLNHEYIPIRTDPSIPRGSVIAVPQISR